jgi:hypothetical protein
MKRALKALIFNALVAALLVSGLFFGKEGAMNVFAGIATVAFVFSFLLPSKTAIAQLQKIGKPSLPIWLNALNDALVSGLLLWYGHFILGGMWAFAAFMGYVAWHKALENKEVA